MFAGWDDKGYLFGYDETDDNSLAAYTKKGQRRMGVKTVFSDEHEHES